jgi:hypothetical protein
MTGTMAIIKLLALLLILGLGIPCQIIDYRHRKRSGYQPGNAWSYYAKLSREGDRGARFMMFSTYVAIYFIVGVIAFGFYALVQAR